jgi:adenosine kinase
MKIIVNGSMAYDRIMDFPGYFHEHILPEKIHVLNVSFTVNGLVEKFGGTAGNIAYALSQLGEKPVILATIGRDYHSYFTWLAENDMACDAIKIIEEELTACAYITTDLTDNQITGFNAGAMKHTSWLDFNALDPAGSIVIIAPGNLEDMKANSAACKARGIGYIFDPGQSLPGWDGGEMLKCIEGSRILISNDYELELIMNKTGQDKANLLRRTGAIITTLGECGSRLSTPEGDTEIPPVKPKKVLDPTGAGDAYRGGLVKGLVQGKSLAESARMGSACAAYAVETYGTQEYSFTLAEFEERLRSAG